MSAAFEKLSLPTNGARFKRDGDKLVVYEVKVQEVGAVQLLKIGGRKAYQCSDGKVFTVATEAAEHEFKLVKEST